MTRESILKRFNDELWRTLDETEGSMDGLTPIQYAAVCLSHFQCEVNNGGLHTYFYNSSGDFASDTPEVMRRIGAREAARILEEANSLFKPDGPSRDRVTRWDQLEQLGQLEEARLDALTREFFRAEDRGLCLADLFDDFVVAHHSDGAG